MGATSEQGSAFSSESPVHSVTLSDYWIGETEVTQALWQAVMGSNPSYFNGSNRPVEQVSWNDCQTFVNKLNSLLSGQLPAGHKFRLPTEAEWEYAARGGNRSGHYKYSGSNNLGSVAWYLDNSGSTTHDVKTKNSNELGIYDMTGNVGEWCEDNWRDNYDASYISSVRVFRGGDWDTPAMSSRVSSRSRCPQNSSVQPTLSLVTLDCLRMVRRHM
jgi:formylglycine-generating enzyme required for sulfatase activity